MGGKEEHWLRRDDELAQSVMNCGDMMAIADGANQLIRFDHTTELDTLLLIPRRRR